MKTKKDYLLRILNSIPTREKFMDGIFYFPPKGEKNAITVVQDYDAWTTKVNSLCKKINLSFNNAINYAVKVEDFNPFTQKSDEEFISQYFIENGVYRLVSLWDVLAQLSNIYFACGCKRDKLGYKVFFIDYNNEIICKNEFSKEFSDLKKRVKQYLKQKDNIEGDGQWEGNHDYISNHLRNPLVHKEDPHETAALDCELNISHHPLYELKRLVEDYRVVNDFLDEIYKLIQVDAEKRLTSIIKPI